MMSFNMICVLLYVNVIQFIKMLCISVYWNLFDAFLCILFFFFSAPLEATTNCTTLTTSDLLCHLISLVTNTPLCLDLVAHQHVLQLAGNLLCGNCFHIFIASSCFCLLKLIKKWIKCQISFVNLKKEHG